MSSVVLGPRTHTPSLDEDGNQARTAAPCARAFINDNQEDSLDFVVLGVNGERYLSHAHTAATLKHGRRPVELRLRHSD